VDSVRPGPGAGESWVRERYRGPYLRDAILAAGGSITHHHGIGRDHRDWYEREIGALATGVLRAVKAELDPAGILNPGILIP
jgi:alkyldihydroxyacetonephosphate synthase